MSDTQALEANIQAIASQPIQAQRRISLHYLTVATRAADAVCLISALGFLCWLEKRDSIFSPGEMLLAGGTACFVTFSMLARCGAYRMERLSGKEPWLLLLCGAVAASTLIFGLELELLPKMRADQLPDIAMRAGAWGGLSFLALSGFRSLLAGFFSFRSLGDAFRRRVALVCDCDFGAAFIQRIENDIEGAVDIVGAYNDRCINGGADALAGYASGDLQDLAARCHRGEVDFIVLVVPLHDVARIDRICHALRNVAVDICVTADLIGHHFSIVPLEAIGRSAILKVRRRPLDDWQQLQKAIFDRLVAGMLLLALSPVFCLIAVAIRLDSAGPILFRQARVGFNNRVFMVYKFRTMFHHGDPASLDGSDQARRNDPRITRIGRFLRHYSFDELPQFLNVIKGEMSIVGPRPHPLGTRVGQKLLHDVVDDYTTRHRVLPGITGWAQVNGWRGETVLPTQIEQRVAHDLFYIENWSMALDIRIVMLTIVGEIISKKAF